MLSKCPFLVYILIVSFNLTLANEGCGPIKLVFYKIDQYGKLMDFMKALHVGVMVCDREFHFVGCHKEDKINFPGFEDIRQFNKENREEAIAEIKYESWFGMGKSIGLFKNPKEQELKFVKNGEENGENVETLMNLGEIRDLVKGMPFDCTKYNLIKKNCVHFAEEFIRKLVGNEEIYGKIDWPDEIKRTKKAANKIKIGWKWKLLRKIGRTRGNAKGRTKNKQQIPNDKKEEMIEGEEDGAKESRDGKEIVPKYWNGIPM